MKRIKKQYTKKEKTDQNDTIPLSSMNDVMIKAIKKAKELGIYVDLTDKK